MKTPNKTIILVAASILIGSALGSGATYAVLQGKDDKKTKIPYAANDAPEAKPKGTADISPAKIDGKLPEGTISPHTVAKKAPEYKGKQLKLRGLVVVSSPGQYSIVGQASGENLGVWLDFSKSKIDPAAYANSTLQDSVTPKTADPVTITGKIVESKNPQGNLIYTFLVESVAN